MRADLLEDVPALVGVLGCELRGEVRPCSMLGAGLLSALLLEARLGGYTPTGATTNTGWFALIVALMCIPFGGLLLALGVAKWLRNRQLARHG